MRTLAYPLALLLVLVVPLALVTAAAGVSRWGGWAVRTGGAIGVVGLVLTAAASVNLLVPRSCERTQVPGGTIEVVNRPLLSIALGDGDCYRAAMEQLGLVGLAAAATSAAVSIAARRSGPGGSGAAPAVPVP